MGGGGSASRISVFEARLVYIVRERHSDSTLPPQNKIIIIKFSFDYEVNYAPPKKRFSSFKVGGVDPKQLAVYEEFARNVPGFLPTNDLSQPTGFLAQPMKVNTSFGFICLCYEI